MGKEAREVGRATVVVEEGATVRTGRTEGTTEKVGTGARVGDRGEGRGGREEERRRPGAATGKTDPMAQTEEMEGRVGKEETGETEVEEYSK